MKKLEYTNLHGIELYATKHTNGKRAWEKLYNYPRIGFGAGYYNYMEPEELGKAFTATSSIDVTTNRNSKKNQWRLNIGTGFVYSTKRFDAETNPNNKAISSKVSYVLRGTVYREFYLNENLYLNANLSFRHFSNGRLNIPNNGMNFPIVGVGLRYLPKPAEILTDSPSPDIDRKIHFNLMAARAWREVLQEDHKHYAYALSFYAQKQISTYNTLLLGMDAFKYDEESVVFATNVHNYQKGIEDDNPNSDGRQLALTIGTEILLGKLHIIYQAGIYLYKPQVFYESSWYQRYGLKYQIIDKAFINTSLKTHSRTADMVEFGLGVRI
ncbi:acyloxyacyl hydrolase [Fulvivirga ligni]|uniref:acyloxyacyl hydrolase n=1 Tax=Fulvivirga ligni TaxID=2904246 RepID=UPI001F199DA6|nr:acyloxyacyl hydrolase [Fulvivirga ligni]UII22158.1 acyloxyacyl hydrolase [Fulvivirga ligni]